MADSLDEEVRALKAWIDWAWLHLGQATLSSSARREIRDQMKEAGKALRLSLQRCAERDREGRERSERDRAIYNGQPPVMRLLNIDGISPLQL